MTAARNQNSLCDRMEKKKTLGETRLSRGASSPLARILLFIYCLLIVLIKILNVFYFYFYIVAISNNNSIMQLGILL